MDREVRLSRVKERGKSAVLNYLLVLESATPLSYSWRKAEDRFLVIVDRLDEGLREEYMRRYNLIGDGNEHI